MVGQKKSAFWMEEITVLIETQKGIPEGWKLQNKTILPNIIVTLFKTSWTRKNRFLVDGLVRGMPTIPNVIVAVLKVP